MRSAQTYYKAILSHKALLGFVLAAFGVLHLYIVLFNHYNFKTFTYDYGVYSFAFFDFAHFRVSACPLYLAPYDITFLQDHFSFTLLILSPLFWIMDPLFGTYSLLILQWVFVMVGAYATYRFILLKSENHWLSIGAVIYYFVLYGRYSAYQNDCNLVTMGSCLFPVFLYLFEKERIWPLVLVCFMIVINREDFSFDLFFLCLALAVVHRNEKQKRRKALIIAAISLLCFVVIFRFVIPLFETDQKSFSLFNYKALGGGPGEALLFMLSHPLKTLGLLFLNPLDKPEYDLVKMQFYLVYLISGGFMLFYRPAYLIALIPLIAKKMFNDDPNRWSHESYQGVELATLLPAFVFSGLAEIRKALLRKILAYSVCICSIEVTLYEMHNSTEYYWGFIKFDVFSDGFRHTNADVKALHLALDKIPADAPVCASQMIASHFAFRDNIRLFPLVRNSEYVCVFKKNDTFPVSQEIFEQHLKKLQDSGEWEVLAESAEYLVLKRKIPLPAPVPAS